MSTIRCNSGALRSWMLVSAAAGVAGDALAQQTMQVRPVPGPVKDAGVYHMATGTWTRGSQHENLGAKVLYSNLANTGFFGFMGTSADVHWTDEGRIPSTGGHANAKSDAYTVQSIQIGYCSSVSGPQTGGLDFYNSYASCTNPTGATVLSVGINVPGGVGGTACWIVTFDLKGTSFEFGLDGDADGTFDGTTALDNFGWTLSLDDLGAGGFNGPMLNGDPNNFPYGDGTYYQNSGATLSTGLGTQDQFWLADPSATIANGCYWFGGYPGGNPFGSWWLLLGGDNGGNDCDSTKYCIATSNSTGAPADIGLAGTQPLALVSAPVPNQPGIFFHALNQTQLPFGNGFLCATGQIVRGAVVVGAGNVATYAYDGSDSKHLLGAYVGQTRNFQHWYRDPMGGGSGFNLSNALSILVGPEGDDCGGGPATFPRIDSFDPTTATAGTVVTVQGINFGFDEDDISMRVIDSGALLASGDVAFTRATSAAGSEMDIRIEAFPSTMGSGRLHLQLGSGVSSLINLPPGILLQGEAWSWVDDFNDGATADSDDDLTLTGGLAVACAGGSLFYGKVQNNRLRITIPAGNAIPAGWFITVLAGAVTSDNDWALECNVTVETEAPLTTCGIGEAVCDMLQEVFDQQHDLFLNCLIQTGGGCATNPTVTVVASGPAGKDLSAGRGAIIICPP